METPFFAMKTIIWTGSFVGFFSQFVGDADGTKQCFRFGGQIANKLQLNTAQHS